MPIKFTKIDFDPVTHEIREGYGNLTNEAETPLRFRP